MYDRGFARQVTRDQIEKGVHEPNMPFDARVMSVVSGITTILWELRL